MRDKSFGLGLLVADLAVVELRLRQDDLDSGGSADTRRLLFGTSLTVVDTACVSGKGACLSCLSCSGRDALLDNEQRVDLVNVAKSISRDQCHSEGLVHALIECLQRDGATSVEAIHHEGDQLAYLRVLGDSHGHVKLVFLLSRGSRVATRSLGCGRLCRRESRRSLCCSLFVLGGIERAGSFGGVWVALWLDGG